MPFFEARQPQQPEQPNSLPNMRRLAHDLNSLFPPGVDNVDKDIIYMRRMVQPIPPTAEEPRILISEMLSFRVAADEFTVQFAEEDREARAKRLAQDQPAEVKRIGVHSPLLRNIFSQPVDSVAATKDGITTAWLDINMKHHFAVMQWHSQEDGTTFLSGVGEKKLDSVPLEDSIQPIRLKKHVLNKGIDGKMHNLDLSISVIKTDKDISYKNEQTGDTFILHFNKINPDTIESAIFTVGSYMHDVIEDDLQK